MWLVLDKYSGLSVEVGSLNENGRQDETMDAFL